MQIFDHGNKVAEALWVRRKYLYTAKLEVQEIAYLCLVSLK
jgi:hypothetical protein